MKSSIKTFSFLFLLFFYSSVFAADFPGGPIAQKQMFFEYAIYLTEPLKKSPLEYAKKHLKKNYPNLKLVNKPVPEKPSVLITLNNKVKSEYAPPGIKTLRYSGKGISKEQATKLQKVSSALIATFAIPLNKRVSGLQDASNFMADLAAHTKGIIWDEETRQCFSREMWVSLRANSFENGIADISKHITIHAYKDNEYIRAITLGMAKFGLPDIEISDFSWSDNRSVGNLINLLAQQTYEINNIKNKGKFTLNVNKIKHTTIRKNTLKALYKNAITNINIHIIKGINDDGDPNNRIIEVVFDNYPGKNKQEKMEYMLSKLWGWEDEITQVKHNDAILEASKQAKRKLPLIMKAIQKGLAPGEYYMVKAPFKTPAGGNEWMWVEIISWKKQSPITGLLKNQPHNIPSLKAGAEVSIKTADVFDYIHRLPNGTTEGNTTGKLIEKYSR